MIQNWDHASGTFDLNQVLTNWMRSSIPIGTLLSLITAYLGLSRALINVAPVPSQNINTISHINSVFTDTPFDVGPFIFDPLNWFFAMIPWLTWIRSSTLSFRHLFYHNTAGTG